MPINRDNLDAFRQQFGALEDAENWLTSARKRLAPSHFSALVRKVFEWLLQRRTDQVLADRILLILGNVDPKADFQRREALAGVIRLEQMEEEQKKLAFIQAEKVRRDEAERTEALKKEREAEDRRRQLAVEHLLLEKKGQFIDAIQLRFKNDFLNADSYFSEFPECPISRKEFEQTKFAFVRNWLTENLQAIPATQTQPDEDQISAISAINLHTQVVARAGSGKTATLVNRAFFLQEHCGVSPSQMMVLAFNKKAAEEIEERLGKLLNGQLPFVMTFHALAHALVHPEENLVHDSSDGRNQALSRFVQGVIDVRLRDPNFHDRIRKVMTAHFQEDWDRIQDGGYHLTKDEMLEYRRSLQRETLRGEFVKSFGEKVIANFLFEHQVPYLYEPSERGLPNYHPDFLIKRGDGTGVCIEYFGMAGDPDYDNMSDTKRRYWQQKRGWTLIECGPQDININGVEGFLTMLRKALEREGFTFSRLSEDEIWHQIRKRAIDRFSSATKGFVARCRKTELTPPTLMEKIATHKSKWQVEADFLDIMVELYEDYLKSLEVEGKEDFDGLLHRATTEIAAGQTEFTRYMKKQHGDLAKLRFLLIDEYQDFSKLFHSMVEAIRQRNTDLKLFCVGDDWQAINGFAGSDLSYYENFSSNFPESEQLQISTNYRSAEGIVAVGNAVMRGRGKPAVAHSADAGHVWMAMPGLFPPTVNEQTRHGDDRITPMVLRLAAWALKRDRDIVVLCRTQNPPGFVNYKAQQGVGGGSKDNGIERFQVLLRSYFPEDQRSKIKVSTAHGFKGLQGSVVLILDAVAGCYPLIHQDWIFLRLFGESVQTITDEARRLFYVALTRAIDTLVIFTDGNKKSPFLEEIQQRNTLHSIKWANFPAVAAKSDRLKVFVGNQRNRGSSPTVAIKDFVKQDGYKYSSLNRESCWVRSFSKTDFNIQTLTSSTWSEFADGVEVHIIDEQDQLVGNYRIDAGNWTALLAYSSKT